MLRKACTSARLLWHLFFVRSSSKIDSYPCTKAAEHGLMQLRLQLLLASLAIAETCERTWLGNAWMVALE